MTYKGYTITADVETHETYEIDDEGELENVIESKTDDWIHKIVYGVSDSTDSWIEVFEEFDEAKKYIDGLGKTSECQHLDYADRLDGCKCLDCGLEVTVEEEAA